MKLKYFFIIAAISQFFFSCNNNNKVERSEELYTLKPQTEKPVFNSANAYMYIEKQLSFGPRNPNSEGHRQTLNYLNGELSKYASKVYLQNFTYPGYDNTTLQLTNIIAEFNPNSTNRIFICAHWDTRPRAEHDKDKSKQDMPIHGANDGGSGVGIILEIARILKEKPVDFGIDLILFDGEDYGKENDLNNYLLGAKYFAANKPSDYQPYFGILLDLVGDKDAEFAKEGYSLIYARDVVEMVWNIADKINANRFIHRENTGVYDDHIALNQAGLKTIDIIDTELIGADSPVERRNYWHSHNDTIENISKETLQQVGDVLIHLIYSLQFSQNKPA